MSKEAILLAGAKFSFDAADDGVMVVVDGIESWGGVGDVAEAKERTTISDEVKVYGAAIPDSPEMSVKGQFYSTSAIQKSFIARCKAKEEFKVKIEWKDGTIAEFTMKTFGFMVDEGQGADWMKFTVPARKNSIVTWTEPV